MYCNQEAVRTVLKQLVVYAVVPSPIRRSVSLLELERGQTMLHWMMVTTMAEDAVGIKPVRGKIQHQSYYYYYYYCYYYYYYY